jgi:uncharacterized protein (DUF362 family)
MRSKETEKSSSGRISRRKFINSLGVTTAGLLVAPYIKSDNIFAYGHSDIPSYVSQVALTRANNYNRAFVKERVAHLFESLGGIGDVVRPGDKIALKINLTGGSGSAYSSMHRGRSIIETMWTHPEVMRAVGELLIDQGISGNDIYIVEALWDDASYNNFGYLDVQNSLGASLVDLNKSAPYNDFIEMPVGDNKFFYDSFTCNRILEDVDVYISIPKMKQHYEAGVTHAIKNQVGMVPIQFYTMPYQTGYRTKLHYEGGNIRTHLPRSICDLFLARPIDFAVIDGIQNAIGGEGVWNPTFIPADYNVLIAGRDPVATDSVASYMMGNDPEADTLRTPEGEYSDNYLKMLSDLEFGTNKMSEIQLVGDGADLITSAKPEFEPIIPKNIQLFDNFPNPFNPSTSIKFYLPEQQYVTIKLYTISGQEVDTLVDGVVPAGQHVIQWMAGDIASGVYIYVMTAGNFMESRRMVYQK